MIVDHYRETVQNKEKEIHRIRVDFQRKVDTIQQLVKQLEEEKAAKEDERKQRDEALTRLSAIAGDRLQNNNPGITDLSDPNRPMKIAEKFTEMYDNDWTDSMEALEDLGLNEEEYVIMLLHFLTKLLDHLKNVRTDVKDDHISACSKFVADCIEYAWIMQIQDPPVYIEWDFPRETKIDTNILRSYTKAGDQVDFIVWPVLYLHKDGPVLNKGVVQPILANNQHISETAI